MPSRGRRECGGAGRGRRPRVGDVAVCARALPGSWHPTVLLTDPAAYALGVSALVGALAYSSALQRGTVTQATAPLVFGETVVPAAVGLFLLGDVPRPGLGLGRRGRLPSRGGRRTQPVSAR